MDKETLERIDKLPKDGKHFTVEGLMEEQLKKNSKTIEPAVADITITQNGVKIGSLNTLTTTDANYGWNTTATAASNYTYINGNGIAIGNGWDDRKYEIDFDQVNSIEDIKALLKQINPIFNGRRVVEGIEHLVKLKE